MDYTAPQQAAFDRSNALTMMDESGLTGALAARKTYEEQQARRGGFNQAAGRGFIGGGMARGAAMPGLAEVDFNAADRFNNALTANIGSLVDQRRFDDQMYLTKEANDLQRESNRPKGLFAALGL